MVDIQVAAVWSAATGHVQWMSNKKEGKKNKFDATIIPIRIWE